MGTKHIDKNDPEVKERVCLSCGFNFLSLWIGNRICSKCKQSWDFRINAEVVEYDTTISVLSD